MRRIALIAGGLLVAAALAGVLRPEGAQAVDDPATQRDTVTVNGMGAVRATPDRASISAGVETRAATAQAALAANADEMNDVLAALRAAGGKDVTTSSVSLSSQQTPDGKPNGFVASNVATAEFTLGQVGKAIDAAVAAGANTVYGPSFSFSNPEALYLKALDGAVANAKSHADRLAAAAGRTLGPVVSMSEGSSSPAPMYAKAAGAVADSTPVVTGEQETSASVSVTYELR
jgi:uncharacterized protein YggE